MFLGSNMPAPKELVVEDECLMASNIVHGLMNAGYEVKERVE